MNDEWEGVRKMLDTQIKQRGLDDVLNECAAILHAHFESNRKIREFLAQNPCVEEPSITEAGQRSALKTTQGGLLVSDKETSRVLFFKVTADDLDSLADSLRKREASS